LTSASALESTRANARSWWKKLAGISVVTGARIATLADSGEVLVSQTVKDLVAGSGFDFVDRGEHELKGVPGTWRVYAVAEG
jgi:class 3 adenylate cyclase